MKKVLVLIVLLINVNNMFGQKIEAPEKGETKTLIRLKIVGDVGKDPSIVCIPNNKDYEVCRDLNGNLQILFVPQKVNSYNFILASNKDSKTILLIHTIDITEVDPPKPLPNPNKYFGVLKTAYQVSPDPENLKVLIEIYKTVSSTNFTTGNEATTTLKTITSQKLTTTQLRSVRDAVAKILTEDLNNDWNQQAFQNLFKTIISALEEIK